MKLNDKVKVVKVNDKFNGKVGTITKVTHFTYVPVTVFKVEFEKGQYREYFYTEILRVF